MAYLGFVFDNIERNWQLGSKWAFEIDWELFFEDCYRVDLSCFESSIYNDKLNMKKGDKR